MIIAFIDAAETIAHRETIIASVRLNGCAKSKNFNEPYVKLFYDGYGNKAKLRSVITECAVIDHFAVPSITASEEKDTLLLTFFQTEKNPHDIMRLLKINPAYYEYSVYGKDTISVPRNIYNTLHANIPYLISMVSSDFSRYTWESEGLGAHITQAPDFAIVGTLSVFIPILNRLNILR